MKIEEEYTVTGSTILGDEAIADLKEHYASDYNIPCIDMLRQWLNEDRIPQGKSVTTRELEHWLEPLLK